MAIRSVAFTQQKLCVEFAALETSCPRGIYVAPVPDEPLVWTGVLFVRRGPYANAVLRFQIAFPIDYPQKPPVVTFQSDLFHPLVSPLTTYTYSTKDFGTNTQSAADDDRLPPGGLSLRHGFPEWFDVANDPFMGHGVSGNGPAPPDASTDHQQQSPHATKAQVSPVSQQTPHIVEVLQYLRIAFETEELLDGVPLDAAANAGAWHAWKSFRSKSSNSRMAPVGRAAADGQPSNEQRSLSPRQQPGGARKPGEWNWQGVWQERVRRCVQSTLTEQFLYGGDSNEVIGFRKADDDALAQMSPSRSADVA